MKYSAKLEIVCDPDKLYDCLAPEVMDFERSKFALKKSDDKVIIDIQAKDAVALRATMNAFTQLLAVYEKAQDGSGKDK